jgi:hypothetical protein
MAEREKKYGLFLNHHKGFYLSEASDSTEALEKQARELISSRDFKIQYKILQLNSPEAKRLIDNDEELKDKILVALTEQEIHELLYASQSQRKAKR